MLKFKKTELYSGKKIEVLDGERKVIINIEYYDKTNIHIVKNLEILNIRNELLPVHYKFEIKKNNYIKKLITFSPTKKLDIHLESLDISSNDLENIYRIIGKNNKIHEVTLLINNVTKEVLYTFDKVYKKEFKY
jgi:hypothetical protein